MKRAISLPRLAGIASKHLVSDDAGSKWTHVTSSAIGSFSFQVNPGGSELLLNKKAHKLSE
jgi:hypothetical protein